MENTEKVNNNENGLDDTEVSIVTEFRKITKRYWDYKELENDIKSNKWITSEIKRSIREIGEKEFDVAPDEYENAWLFDLVWYTNKDNHLEKVVLALESELSDRSKNGLKYDFEKLLIINSKYKIFICFGEGNNKHPQNVNNLITFFEECVNSYSNLNNDFRILILIWEDYQFGNVFPHLITKQ